MVCVVFFFKLLITTDKIQFDTAKSLWYLIAIVFSDSEGLWVGSSLQNDH